MVCSVWARLTSVWRWATIAATVAIFALSIYGMRFVQQQFFPSSDRPEIIVDLDELRVGGCAGNSALSLKE